MTTNFKMFTVSTKDKSNAIQVTVSPEDFDDVQKHKWYPLPMTKGSDKYYLRTFISRKLVNLHHYVYSRMDPEFKGLPPGHVIDQLQG